MGGAVKQWVRQRWESVIHAISSVVMFSLHRPLRVCAVSLNAAIYRLEKMFVMFWFYSMPKSFFHDCSYLKSNWMHLIYEWMNEWVTAIETQIAATVSLQTFFGHIWLAQQYTLTLIYSWEQTHMRARSHRHTNLNVNRLSHYEVGGQGRREESSATKTFIWVKLRSVKPINKWNITLNAQCDSGTCTCVSLDIFSGTGYGCQHLSSTRTHWHTCTCFLSTIPSTNRW